jgi:hydrogenase nickel incorporation protein HypA/HybF
MALLRQVEEIAKNNGASSVDKIVLSIGPLAGVEASLLENAFLISCPGTVAENAQLICESSDIKVKCHECGQKSIATINRLLCEECGSWKTSVISGDELLLKQVGLVFK